MSKVALRVYNREIETLIDQGHIDEAITHCQHILKTYPKHLETYRALGNAYLEARRYSDAADIFQRVLTSVPDDFVSHLGMSIVYDEQKNLDQAIWHMERAYEANPSNGGVQAELRRLYGRRDGLEPPKIQLTRGALAKMYIRGSQYGQAIQEIKTVLQDDKERLDLKVLMAQAYFRSGKKLEASEVCTEILKVSPYCFDANRILVEILPGTSLASNVDTYKRRLQQLDPYIALVTGSTFDVASVQDAAVTIERLEWDPSMASASAAWQSDESAAPAAEETTQEDIPDWMKSSGWGPSSGEFQEGPVDFDESPSAETAGELAAAEIPDWLKAMAPPGAAAEEASRASAKEEDADLDWLSGISAAAGSAALGAAAATDQSAAEESAPVAGDVPDWLSGLGEQQPAAQESAPVADDNADWLSGLGAESAQPAAEESAPVTDDVPDWLSGLGEQQPAAQESAPVADDNADWLSGLGAESAQPAAEESAPVTGEVPDWLSGLGEQQPAAQESAPVADDNADWLSGLGAESAEPAAEESAPVAGDVPDWLSGLGEQQPAAQEAAPVADDNADWLAGLGAESAQPAVEESAPVSGDVLDWLSGLGEQQPAAQESAPVADDNADWLAGLGAAAGVAAVAAAVEPPVAEEPAPVSDVQPELAPREGLDGEPLSALISGPGTTESEQDEAFKWLEMLAAGQGAKPEELLTKPEERLDQAPDWVDGVDEAAPAAAAPAQAPQFVPEPPIEVESEPALTELSAPVTAPGTSELEQDDAFKWLESLAAGQGAKPEELLTKPEERLEQAPGWVGEVENPPTVLSAPVTAPGTSESDQDESFKWLENLAAGQGAKPEELLTKPEERLEHSPEWLSEAEGEPEIPAANLEEPVLFAEPVAELVEEPLPLEEPVAEPPAQPLPPVVRVDEEGNPLGELSAPVTAPGTSEDEQDAAFKWLEMLAAGQGAKPEELLTKPEERLDQSPEWVAEVTSQPEPEPEPAQVEPIQFEPEPEPAEVEALQFEPEPEPAAEAPVFPIEEPAPAAESVEEVSLSEPVLDWFASDEPQSEQPEMQVFEQTVEAVEQVSSADLDKMGVTEWLKTLDDEESLPQPAVPAVEALQPHLEEDLPDWLKDEKADELPPEPMPVSGWIPAEEAAPVSELVAETPQPAAAVAETPIQAPAESAPPPAPVAETRPAPTPPPAPRPALRQTGMLGGDKDAMLLQRSRLLLEKANLESAMSEYSRLIKKGKYMEEIIFDLKEATYTHPVDVIVWQTLGDAYMRTNRLQEALDAYTKAEELLR